MAIGVQLDPGDGQWVNDASIDENDKDVLNSVDADFQPGDVGKLVLVEGAAGTQQDKKNLLTTISAFVNSNQVELADEAAHEVSSAFAVWGTDWTEGTSTARNIQAAIDSVEGSGGSRADDQWGAGGIVCLQPGIYLISKSIEVRGEEDEHWNQNISIWGAGPLATVVFNVGTSPPPPPDDTSGAAIFVKGVAGDPNVSVHGFSMRDISVRGNADSGVGVYLERVIRQVKFERVNIGDHGGHGVHMFEPTNMISFSGCKIHDNGADGIRCAVQAEQIWLYGNSIVGNKNGLYLYQGNNVVSVYGGEFQNNETGIRAEGRWFDDAHVSGCEFRGNRFESNGRDVVVTNQPPASDSLGIVISGNLFSKTTGKDSEGSPLTDAYSVELGRAKDCVIQQNEFRTIDNVNSANVKACIGLEHYSVNNEIGQNTFGSDVTRPKLFKRAAAGGVPGQIGSWGFVDLDVAEQYYEFPYRENDESQVTLRGDSRVTIRGDSQITMRAGLNMGSTLRFMDSTEDEGVAVGFDADGESFFIKGGTPPDTTHFFIDRPSGRAVFKKDVSFLQPVGVGSSGAVASSAIMELTASNQGLLLPRMHEFQRDAIVNPPAGLVIYNMTTNGVNFFNGTSWK